MKFDGEHLLPGQIGHFFVVLAFVASILSTIAFYKASRVADENIKRQWLSYAKTIFFIQVASVLTIFFTIFFICSNHYFEYLYAYKHASKELEPKYLLACIWEGQEGSFLLWSIWHCVLGTIFIIKGKSWTAHVLTVISFAQCFLMLMLLGIYIFDVRIGSSAFVLTRNEINGPIFSQPDYLSFIKDGIGLNVLLRNYWMVIHPPVLFLGFASTIIPVSYAYAGMATKKFGEWIKPALPWALFSCCVLGVGIMMGGKWAYESLSFGGYWAWDPVENASLVPWIILIAGLHCMVIFNATGNSLRTAFLFIILANAFVLYSTFLTRTGILGDTSVHSFTESGMAMNILIGMFAIAIPVPMIILYIRNYHLIPSTKKEESISSREFWMFIGSLILFLSAIFIIAVTSVPVYNKIFHTNIADPQDREFTYNKVMVMVAIIVGLLSATTQYFKYRQTNKKYFIKLIALPFVTALVLCILLFIFYPVIYIKQGAGFLGAIYLALFASLFSAIANAGYIWSVLKGNLKSAGAALAHAGFTLMIAGMLISAGNKQVISDNRVTGLLMPFDKDPTGKQTEDPLENLTLIRDVPTSMARYTLTYEGDSAAAEKNRTFFKLIVQKKDSANDKVLEDFELMPDVYKMKDNNLSSNPDIKHYVTHDIFTYISSLPDRSSVADTAKFKLHEMKLKDTVYYSKGFLVLNDVLKNPSTERFHYKPTDTALVADITVYSKAGTSYKSFPALAVQDLHINFIDDTVYAQNLYLQLAGIGQNNTFKIAVKETDIPQDFITLKAYVFPYINLVWTGLIIMAAGFIVSIIKRTKAKPAVALIALIAVVAGLFYMFMLASV
ncbi:MAG: cytochrome c biogenesis protein CcsA [Chitinophagaceae bacterium]|nr:cytochrome c biogenesis protein CcsA [Chitinophagaceae bacterium]